MSPSNLAFSTTAPVLSTSTLTTASIQPSRVAIATTPATRRTRSATSDSPSRPETRTPQAVLDTPASNTYLQRQSEVVLRDFLTRRAVNTVMYYMEELGDGPSHNWLSRFEDFSRKVSAHLFSDGDGFLDRMLRAKSEECTMKIGHPSGRFSRTFNFTIEPHRIATRIFDIRVHLAREWAHDLRCVEVENLEIQRLSFERLVSKTEAEFNSKRNIIFDSDPFAIDQTPLRFKNYVALKTLITQQAVARLLPFLRDQGSNHDYMYLLQFVNSYGPIADGDKFVHELMAKPVETRTNPTFEVVPKGIAMQVMDLRAAVAEEWIAVMEFVPEEFNLMKRGILERSMEASRELSDN